jgi:hypothetical protein
VPQRARVAWDLQWLRGMTTTAWVKVLGACSACALLAAACGVDGPPLGPAETTGNPQGSGGEMIQDPSSSGSGNADPSSGSGQPAPECPYTGPPPIDPSTLPECPTCSAGGAHCLPNSLLPPEFLSSLDSCDADSACVPDAFIETNGLFIAPTCDSVGGAEGRCLSRCIPQVAGQADLLPQATCETHEVCVPCYDPLTADSTGACELSCDPGPTEPPASLPKCCGGQGTCVPADAAGEQADQLGEDDCPQDAGALLCAPDVFVNDPNWSPPPCETELIQSVFGSQYGPGACLPDCLPDVDNFLIGQDDCADGFKCAPCLKPPFGQSSGACDL